MKCPNCGAEVSADQVICEECFVNIEEARKSKIQSATKSIASKNGTNEEVARLQRALNQSELDKTIQDASDSTESENADLVKGNEQQINDPANYIADMFLTRFPRQYEYPINYFCSEWKDNFGTYYFSIDEQQAQILKECSEIAKEEGTYLQEVLENEDHYDLIDYLSLSDNPYHLDTIESIDFDKPLKFTRFSYRVLNPDGTLDKYKTSGGVELTDEEYKEILIELMIHENRYSMNMLVYHKPEICQKIMKHLVRVSSWDPIGENYDPFISDMDELKTACEQILNPFKDVLGIFKSKNMSIRRFAIRNQIIPGCEPAYEIYETREGDSFHISMIFQGTDIEFVQEGDIFAHGKWNDSDSFTVAAEHIMKSFSLNSPKEIYPYIKAHFNNRDGLQQLREKLKQQ